MTSETGAVADAGTVQTQQMEAEHEEGEPDDVARWAYRFFMAGLLIQGLHMVEHTVQLHQWLMFVPDPEGLFGHVFNFVWVHFIFNTSIFLVLVGAYIIWLRRPGIWQRHETGRWLFHGTMGVQAYHVIEHSVQMYQYYAVGMLKPPGVIGQIMPGVLAHFDINALFTLLLVGTFLAFRPDKLAYRVPTGSS